MLIGNRRLVLLEKLSLSYNSRLDRPLARTERFRTAGPRRGVGRDNRGGSRRPGCRFSARSISESPVEIIRKWFRDVAGRRAAFCREERFHRHSRYKRNVAKLLKLLLDQRHFDEVVELLRTLI